MSSPLLSLASFESRRVSPEPFFPSRRARQSHRHRHRAMEDASSDFSDWEVLSAASAPDDDVVLVSGGHVLHDHFGLHDPSSPAANASFWSEDEEVESGLGSVHGIDSISPEPVDLTILTAPLVDSTAQLRLGGADVTVAQGSLLPASSSSSSSASTGGAAWTAQVDEQIPAQALIEAARSCGESDSIPMHQGVQGILCSDATAAVDGVTEDSGVELEHGGADNSAVQVQLEDGGADDATAESSVLEDAATRDELQTAPADEPEQVKGASAGSGYGESDGGGKDGSAPLVAAAAASPATGEGERQVVVWWRLPFRLIHYCAWKVKPVWSVSIAAAFLGIVVLGRRMYRMRRKAQGLPQIKIALDDKRASQFADRTARLNEAFLIAKRIPALRTSSGAALPWSMMQER